MASILNVDQINNAAGTSGIALDASTGKASFPNGATLPAGSVLQVVREFTSNQSPITTSSTSYVGSGITAAITPLISGSIILVDFTISMADAISTGMPVKMYYKTGAGSYGGFESGGEYQIGYQDSSTNRYASMTFGGKITTTSTSTLTFQPYFYSVNGNTVRLAHDQSSNALTLMEIAQ